ncbi:response regulator [Vibrio cholerae]|jgi:two-component system, chemotaxis family, chemotaxis protein CheY|uniref:Two-component system response regulator n=2 Tax=Vibrio TaxID=662 RepID=A0A395U3A3_VIBCL|nr:MULTISPECIES: response regulator [Vibrio]EJL6266806.1 response regulator [Vibrio cholerae]EJL6280537.1 response regulator [Vibrio cholerae]EJX9123493.1 response regulator [Vibrio cholerae]EJY0786295.1 response regulator [Vibrio cholerae]EKF9485895.1 response regulator [Vibrio cholerae]
MPINVTVADDSKMSRKCVIRAIPQTWEVDITEAENGKQAIEKYNSGLADVMFLDLTMPEMDGIEVLEYLHNIDAKCVVIVISADIQPLVQQRVRELGAFTFLQKPLDPASLEATLHEAGLL